MNKESIIPKHVGIILDGNRRWAKLNGLPKLEGHRVGSDNLKKVATKAFDLGVTYVSAFVFSTENWKRTKTEVNYLMRLVHRLIVKDLKDINNKGIRVRWLGSKSGVDRRLVSEIEAAEKMTKDNDKGTLAFCFNYGGQQEIVDAVKQIISLSPQENEINRELISEHIYCPDIPEVDLLIRTSGEQRISNFMLWRAAYSELYFSNKLWPDFTEEDLSQAIKDYGNRARRFGN